MWLSTEIISEKRHTQTHTHIGKWKSACWCAHCMKRRQSKASRQATKHVVVRLWGMWWRQRMQNRTFEKQSECLCTMTVASFLSVYTTIQVKCLRFSVWHWFYEKINDQIRKIKIEFWKIKCILKYLKSNSIKINIFNSFCSIKSTQASRKVKGIYVVPFE